MTTEPTQDDLRRLVNDNIHYCVSALVSTLAAGYGTINPHLDAKGDLAELTMQAAELAAPIPDYEEAATQAGWEVIEAPEDGKIFINRGATGEGEIENAESSPEDASGWEDLCRECDIKPHDRDVYEHWLVSDWLADKLEAHGEKVNRDFAGMTVWARTTTGQAIMMDSVMAAIWRELHGSN